jgi:DNA-binding cell septation regulator SpoVG
MTWIKKPQNKLTSSRLKSFHASIFLMFEKCFVVIEMTLVDNYEGLWIFMFVQCERTCLSVKGYD